MFIQILKSISPFFIIILFFSCNSKENIKYVKDKNEKQSEPNNDKIKVLDNNIKENKVYKSSTLKTNNADIPNLFKLNPEIISVPNNPFANKVNIEINSSPKSLHKNKLKPLIFNLNGSYGSDLPKSNCTKDSKVLIIENEDISFVDANIDWVPLFKKKNVYKSEI